MEEKIRDGSSIRDRVLKTIRLAHSLAGESAAPGYTIKFSQKVLQALHDALNEIPPESFDDVNIIPVVKAGLEKAQQLEDPVEAGAVVTNSILNAVRDDLQPKASKNLGGSHAVQNENNAQAEQPLNIAATQESTLPASYKRQHSSRQFALEKGIRKLDTANAFVSGIAAATSMSPIAPLTAAISGVMSTFQISLTGIHDMINVVHRVNAHVQDKKAAKQAASDENSAENSASIAAKKHHKN